MLTLFPFVVYPLLRSGVPYLSQGKLRDEGVVGDCYGWDMAAL
jgi:hypothetical protein